MSHSENIKHTCSYSYDVKSEARCLNISWTFLNYGALTFGRKYFLSPFLPDPEYQLELCFWRFNDSRGLENISLTVSKCSPNLVMDIFAYVLDVNGKELFFKRILERVFETSSMTLMVNLDFSVIIAIRGCPNGIVTFNIEFRIKSAVPWVPALYAGNVDTKLTDDLKRFILEELPTEVALKTEDEEIHVNKAILCARSPVFRKMFSHPVSEQDNIVFIEDLKGSTVRNLVKFLYFGKVDLENEFSLLKEIYYAADKYNIMDLRNACALKIISMLTVENWREVVELAWKHSDVHLEKVCMIFIGQNMARIMETNSWMELKSSNPKFQSLVFELVAKSVIKV